MSHKYKKISNLLENDFKAWVTNSVEETFPDCVLSSKKNGPPEM